MKHATGWSALVGAAIVLGVSVTAPIAEAAPKPKPSQGVHRITVRPKPSLGLRRSPMWVHPQIDVYRSEP